MSIQQTDTHPLSAERRGKRIDETDAHIGSRIRQRRKALGLSQQALGSAIGVSFQQLQKYENGTNRCSGSKLAGLAEQLQVPVQYFFPKVGAAIAMPQPEPGFKEQLADIRTALRDVERQVRALEREHA